MFVVDELSRAVNSAIRIESMDYEIYLTFQHSYLMQILIY